MNAGDLVFQRLSFDPKSAAVGLHELTLFRIPHFCHCGIYDTDGKMFTASGHVELQDAGASNNVAVPFAWTNWDVTRSWLQTQIGKPYDWLAWGMCAVEPLTRMFYHPSIDPKTFMCSTIVAAALIRNNSNRFSSLNYRLTTPDDIARAVGFI
jgi:cell wall-associated NlpC family hydrolase